MVRQVRKTRDTIKDDMLFGANEIAKFLGCDQRKVFYYKAKRLLPFGTVGKELVASKSQLREHIAAQIEPAE